MSIQINGPRDNAIYDLPKDFTLEFVKPRDLVPHLEVEIVPVSQVVMRRNKRLESLGDTLSGLSRAQASFDETSKPDDTQSTSQETARLVNSLSSTRLLDDNGIVTKANCEIASQLIKAEMDKLNNDFQTNPGRLQPLVNVQRFI